MQRPLRAVLAAQRQRECAGRAGDADDRRFEVKPHAVGFHRRAHDRREVGVLARQDAGRHVDQRDVAAQAPERLRELAADRAAADDDERRHGLAQVEHRLVRQVRNVGEAGDRRHRRAASRSR